MSDLFVARNGWNASWRSRVGVGMNMSAREGKKRFERSN